MILKNYKHHEEFCIEKYITKKEKKIRKWKITAFERDKLGVSYCRACANKKSGLYWLKENGRNSLFIFLLLAWS